MCNGLHDTGACVDAKSFLAEIVKDPSKASYFDADKVVAKLAPIMEPDDVKNVMDLHRSFLSAYDALRDRGPRGGSGREGLDERAALKKKFDEVLGKLAKK